MFNGTPAPGDINGTPSYNLTEFLEKHSVEVTDPLIASAVDYLKNDLGAKNVVVTGYCFGGRYSFRLLGEGMGVVAAFAAHPSFVEDDEITGITGPISIAAAGKFINICRTHSFEANDGMLRKRRSHAGFPPPRV